MPCPCTGTAPSASPGSTACRSPTTRSRCEARTFRGRRLVGLDRGALPRRPRPGPRQRRGPARPPGHRAAAGRRGRRGAGPDRDRLLRAGGHEARRDRPGRGDHDRPREARDRHRHPRRRRDRARPPRPARASSRCGRRSPRRSRRSSPAPSGAPTRACGTRRRCTTTRCTPGFVHHTVNANDYTRDQVPSIIRGIYAYHARSRGWSDIGYNFLVDRFGRIWEGRYGGVDRPVVGAHTLGYNDNAFAASAIGNFETARPSRAMIRAYGALFAWKLSLHGVKAADSRQYVTSRLLQGDQRPPRRGLHRLPGHQPLQPDPADPGAGDRGAAGLGRPRARVQPGRQRPAGPGAAPGGRRHGLHPADRPDRHRLPARQEGVDRARCSPTPTGSSRPATGTSTATATSSSRTAARCGSTAASARASSPTPTQLATGFGRRHQARGRRRLHRRRPAGPDGPAGAAARCRSTRATAPPACGKSLRGVLADPGPQADPDRALGRRRRTRQPDPHPVRAGPLLRQRPRRLHPPEVAGAADQRLRLVDRRRRRRHDRPQRPDRPHERAPASCGSSPAAPPASGRRWRSRATPRGTTWWAEARRPDEVPGAQAGKRAVACSATSIASSRSAPARVTRTREPPFASGSVKVASSGGEAGLAATRRRPPSVTRVPAAAASHSSCWVTPGAGEVDGVVVGRRRVPGRERVRLRPDLDADVVHAGRHRRGEPHPERQQRAGEYDALRGVACPALEAVRTAHDRGRVVGVGHDETRAPRGAEEHRGEPVRRQVDPQRVAALEPQLVDEERPGLGDPVGVGRHRQLDPFAGLVVVERHQRPAGIAAQSVGEHGSERRHGAEDRRGTSRLESQGGGVLRQRADTWGFDVVDGAIDAFWAVVPAGGAGTRLWPLSRSSSPKFLHDLTGEGRTLLEQTHDRLAPLVEDRFLVVTGRAHEQAVRAQLPTLGSEPCSPSRRRATRWRRSGSPRRSSSTVRPSPARTS